MLKYEEYPDHLTPWIPNHLAEESTNYPADFLYGAVYAQAKAGKMQNAENTNNLLSSALITNFFLTLFSEGSTKKD